MHEMPLEIAERGKLLLERYGVDSVDKLPPDVLLEFDNFVAEVLKRQPQSGGVA